MTDEELIDYFRVHSRTERALFARGHVVRMLKLAGKPAAEVDKWPAFIAVHSSTADYWIELVRRRTEMKTKLRVVEGEKK